MYKTAEEKEYWYKKGIKYYNEKSYGIAIQCFNRHLDLRSEDGFATWYMKGNAFYHLREYDKAIDCFNRSLS